MQSGHLIHKFVMALLTLIISEAEQIRWIYYIYCNRNSTVLTGISILHEELIVQLSCCFKMCFLSVVKFFICVILKFCY